ncbi:hypothetical protein [Halobacillus salinus]|uniref:hypothetical protein n=1 Tax=Halobacillus salinus TaxID=192814 RepID=UPI0009A7CD41|nr:hypothetical protein [Halobacillus salinus]
MKKFFTGALLALLLVFGNIGFSSVASQDPGTNVEKYFGDPGDSGIGIVEPQGSEDPGDSGIG